MEGELKAILALHAHDKVTAAHARLVRLMRAAGVEPPETRMDTLLARPLSDFADVQIKGLLEDTTQEEFAAMCHERDARAAATRRAAEEAEPEGWVGGAEFGRRLEGDERVARLLREHAELEAVVAAIRERSDEWNEVANTKGIRTQWRREEDSAALSIRIHGVVDEHVFNALSLILEVDLIDSFVPRTESRLLHEVSRFCMLAYFRLKLLWPMAHRDAVLLGRGVNALADHRLVGVVASSEEDAERWPQAEFPGGAGAGHVRMAVNLAGGLVYPVSEKLTFVSMVANIDPVMAYIPMPFINWVNKHLAYYGFVMFRRKARRIKGSEHEKRMEEKRDVYDYIAQQIDSHFETDREAHGGDGVGAICEG